MQPLVTRSDMARYKQMAKTTHDEKLNEQILDAQLLDIQPLIGESLFNKIIAAPQAYADLLEGGIYEYEGISYTNYGLKMVLAYYTYARYVMFSSAIDTPFSVVEKLSDNSRPAESLARKTLYTLNREAAVQIWGNVKNYLIRTQQPDYITCNTPPPKGFRLKKIT